MKKFQYCLVDVFTNRAFGGNPLAVFTHADGLSSDVMQALAKELNLSETTFVLPAQNPAHDYHVRIFTPTVELPMAGHPTVGTAFVLAHEHMIQLSETSTAILFEEGVGIIPVTLTSKEGHLHSIQMRQPLPTFGSQFSDREAIAEMLSLDLVALDATLPFEVVSCGVPFLFVPVKDLAAMRAIRFRRDVWERVLRDFEAPQLFVFTQEVEVAGSTVHSRMFAPALGITEDPATGAASGPLGCYLVHHGRVKPANTVEIISEQGFEMGRPSFIQVTIEQEGGQITGVYVGGQCYFMGKGYIELSHNSEQGLVKKQGLTQAELTEIEALASLCNRYEGLDLKLNRDILRNRSTNETNDFLYYEDGQLVGYLALFSFNSQEAEISGMVHPDYRRRGIFSTLLTAAKDECQRRRVPKLLLIVEHASHSGQAFAAALHPRYDHTEYKMELEEARMPSTFNDQLHFRRARLEDAPMLAHITAISFNMDEKEVNWYAANGMDLSDRRYFVATLGDTDTYIGKIDVSFNEHEAVIYGFGVLPEYRGQGCGRQMLARTIQEIFATGRHHIGLEVATENKNALSLYQSCGFRETGSYDYYSLEV